MCGEGLALSVAGVEADVSLRFVLLANKY